MSKTKQSAGSGGDAATQAEAGRLAAEQASAAAQAEAERLAAEQAAAAAQAETERLAAEQAAAAQAEAERLAAEQAAADAAAQLQQASQPEATVPVLVLRRAEVGGVNYACGVVVDLPVGLIRSARDDGAIESADAAVAHALSQGALRLAHVTQFAA